jgi:hypothetical protein
MPRDIDLEAELRREAMDRLIAASSTSAPAGREAGLPARGVAANTAPGRTPGPNGNIPG